MREILREARQFNPNELRIAANASVVGTQIDDESMQSAALGDFIGEPISLQAKATGSPEAYDIVLMRHPLRAFDRFTSVSSA